MKIKRINSAVINRFEKHLIDEEKSKNTVDKYIRDVKMFSAYVGERDLSKEIAIDYKHYLQDNGYAVCSINSIIASINSLFIFINRIECKLKSIKLQRKNFCPDDKELTKEEYIRLIKAASRKGNERLGLIIQTICGTGIRVSELKFITVDAVRRGEAVVSLKGKTRSVFIVKELKKKLLRYIAEQKLTEGSVFITHSGKPINRTNIWREMKKLCKEADVSPDKVFPHNLRHLFARIFYKMEKDIAKLADILGHSSIDTTRIYIITTKNEYRRRMENMRLII